MSKRSRRSEVQSVVFYKKDWTPLKARKWLEIHGFKVPAVDVERNTLRYRQKPPKNYKKYATIKTDKGVNLVLGLIS